MKFLFCIITFFISVNLLAQNENDLVQKLKTKLDKVNDYQAKGKMKMNVSFINAPPAQVDIYYKKPNRFKVKKEGGISILPKGSVSININSLLIGSDFVTVPSGKENIGETETTVVKLIPNDDNSDVVLTKLYIDEKNLVVRKAVVTTRESGTYEIELEYGKFTTWGLPDKVIFSFNAKDYKMPKGITFEYEKGGEKTTPEAMKNKKGKVEITYSNYEINKGIPDSVFQ